MNDSQNESHPSPPLEDRRLYVIDGDWSVAVTRGSVSQYCYRQNVGEPFFHLIVDGEIFLDNGDERLCLNCALRQGLVTTDRLAWQRKTGMRRTSL